MNIFAFTGLLIWAGLIIYFDLRFRRIPNVLSVGGILVALLILMLTGETLTNGSSYSAFYGFLLAMLLTAPGYMMRRLGAGDVKLLAAIGLVSDWKALLVTYVLASLLSLCALLVQNRLRMVNSDPFTSNRQFPIGAMFAIAFIAVYQHHYLMVRIA